MYQRLHYFAFIMSILLLWVMLPNSNSYPAHSESSSYLNTNNWNSLVKEAMKFFMKQKQEPQKMRLMVDSALTENGKGNENSGAQPGLVKLRNIRSGYGDVMKLVQLHELEKEWASKARPRFGKRGEVAQVPPYFFDDDSSRNDEYNEHESQAGFGFPNQNKGVTSGEDYTQSGRDGYLRDYFPPTV